MKRLFNFDTAAILYEEKDALSKVSLSSGKAVASSTMAALCVFRNFAILQLKMLI